MNRQRAVREPDTIGVLDNVDDATHHVDEADRQWSTHRHDHSHGGRSLGEHEQTGALLHFPGPESLGCLREDEIATSESA